MRSAALCFFAGTLLLHSLTDLPAPGWGGLGLAGAVVLIRCGPWLRLPGWGLAGFGWALLWTPTAFQVQLPAALESIDLRVTGWVASMPEVFYRSTRFQLTVDTLEQQGVPVPLRGRLRLSWYNDAPPLGVGDKWQLTVRLKRPRNLANPGGFDRERWLFINDIAAQGYVRSQPEPRLLVQADRYPLDRFRQRVAEDFARLLPDSPYRGILSALAVGEEQGIQPQQWDVFTRTGTGHLISISGLHIGLVAGLVFLLVRHGWAWFPPLALRLPAGKAAAVAALLGAGGYALLAGLSLPTQRSWVMVAVMMLALLSQRPVASSRVLALALLAVLILDPAAPLSSGFWLSFGAVAAILYSLTGRRRTSGLVGEWIRLQLAVTLALLPLTLLLFQQIQLLSPVANLIAIPWTNVTVVPLTLLAVLAGSVSETVQAGLLALAALAMDGLWRFLVWVGKTPWGLVFYPAPPLWTLAFGLPGLLWLLMKGLPARWLGGVLCLPMLFFPTVRPASGGYWFTLLDVGQGLAAVVRTERHVLVYDTGPRRGSGFDAGRFVLVPFLRQQGVGQVDTLIVSHADNAHMGGTRSLLEQFAVGQILTSSPQQVPIRGAQPCQAGLEWTWDEVRFQLLHPPAGGVFSGDNASCVLRVEGRQGKVLLPGDIEAPAAAALVRTYGSELAAQVLVAPHHGTRDVDSPAFIAAVQPEYVLFATGYGDRYPKPETVSRYQGAGAVVLDTADQGSITFRFEAGEALRPESYRQQVRRYWHTP